MWESWTRGSAKVYWWLFLEERGLLHADVRSSDDQPNTLSFQSVREEDFGHCQSEVKESYPHSLHSSLHVQKIAKWVLSILHSYMYMHKTIFFQLRWNLYRESKIIESATWPTSPTSQTQNWCSRTKKFGTQMKPLLSKTNQFSNAIGQEYL